MNPAHSGVLIDQPAESSTKLAPDVAPLSSAEKKLTMSIITSCIRVCSSLLWDFRKGNRSPRTVLLIPGSAGAKRIPCAGLSPPSFLCTCLCSQKTEPEALVPQGPTSARRNAAKLVQYDRRAARHSPPPSPPADKPPERKQRGRRRVAHSCSLQGSVAPLSSLSEAPLLFRSILSPGTRSMTPAHIHSPYRRVALAFQRTG